MEDHSDSMDEISEPTFMEVETIESLIFSLSKMEEDSNESFVSSILDKNTVINNLDLTFIREIVKNKIGLVFAALGLPFSAVENEFFIDLLETMLRIDPNKMKELNPLCRQSLAKRILPKIYEKIEKIKKKFLQNTDCIMLCDRWKNKSANKKLMICVRL